MKWVLSDGTEVFLGGRVRGNSALAEAVRADALRAKAGFAVPVQVEVHPSAPRRLDVDDAQLVHEWLRAHALRADATITSAPKLEAIERFDPPEPVGGPKNPIH